MDIKELKKFENYLLEKHSVDVDDLIGIKFVEDENEYKIVGANWAVELEDACTELNVGWDAWQAAKASTVPQWISTSDRMPEEGEEVLVHNLGQVRQVTRDSAWVGGFKERNCYGWQAAYSQSHWMPKSIELPERYHFYYENDAKQKAMIEAAQEQS